MNEPISLIRPVPESAFSMEFVLRSTDTDLHDRLHLSALFRFLQEVAYFHAEKLGLGADQLARYRSCWILLKVSLRLDGLPSWGSTVQITTWQRGVRRLVFIRDFVLSVNGRPFAIVSSEWLVADLQTHRPQRPDRLLPPELVPPLTEPCFTLPEQHPARQNFSAATGPVARRSAYYSDIDRNRHMNNTRYITWLTDALAAWKSYDPDAAQPRHQLRELTVQFISEALPGQTADLYVQPQDGPFGSFLFEARRPDDPDGRPILRAAGILESSQDRDRTGSPDDQADEI